MLLIHNPRLLDYLRYRYSPGELQRLLTFLREAGTFHFPALPNGLFPAAHVATDDPSGYASVWIRDNVHVAHALWYDGQIDRAVRAVQGMIAFLSTQLDRVARVLAGELDPDEPMNRPHIRFDGHKLTEIDVRWSHAQNDALGYFLWITARLLRQGHLPLTDETAEVVTAIKQLLDTRVRPAVAQDGGEKMETD